MPVTTIKAKIGPRSVAAAPLPPPGAETWLWDTEVKGFFLRVYPTGRKVYGVKCRVGARQCIYTIGVHGSPWTPDAARNDPEWGAKEAVRLARAGEDPNARRKASREALTVADLIDRYLEEGPKAKTKKRPISWATDASNLNRHVRPLWARKLADHLTTADAAKLIRDIGDGKTATKEKTKSRGLALVKGGPGIARRTQAVASAMFAWGVKAGHVASNPFKGLGGAASPEARERFLSKAEAGALLDAIAEMQREQALSATFGDAVRLLLLTGARKTEILGLRWAEVEIDRRQLTLPPARTKAGAKTGERRIMLSPPAMAILAERRAAVERARQKATEVKQTLDAPVFVFPAARGQGHAVGLAKAFAAVCGRAGLSGVRIHDLRHSFASFAVADGASLFLVSKLLGHANASTTERYAHLSADPLADAVKLIGRRIMGGADDERDADDEDNTIDGQGANVIELEGRR